jgi:hypothetical protein
MTDLIEIIFLIALIAMIGYLVGKQGSKKSTSFTAAIKDDFSKAASDVRSDLPDLRADAMAAVTKVETWLTDTTAEDASIAKATAAKAAKAQALTAHVATLTAAAAKTAAATIPAPPPSA